MKNKQLPFWWMALTEIVIAGFAIYFISEGKYIEALLGIILIEVRDMSWRLKANKEKDQ